MSSRPDGSEADSPALESAVGEAIGAAIAQHERGLVTKWVALVETIGPDGTRGLWTMTSPDVKAWDTTGLLVHALHLQQAQAVNRPE